MDAALWGFIGTLVGALASIGTTYLNNREKSKARIEELERKELMDNIIFQRETLLELQTALRKHHSFSLKLFVTINDFYDDDGNLKSDRESLYDKYYSDLLELNNSVSILKDRIFDKDLREKIHACLLAYLTAFKITEDKSEFEDLSSDAIMSFNFARDSIGESLRNLYPTKLPDFS